MARRKLSAALILLLSLALFSGGAAPAAILQKGSQIVNLVVPATNNGSIAFNALMIRRPDGSTAPYTLPPNSVLMITKVAWNFKPADTQFSGLVQLNLGEYYRARAQVINSYCSGNDLVLPGAPAANMSALIYLERVGDPDRTPLPGTLSMRLVCYTVPDN